MAPKRATSANLAEEFQRLRREGANAFFAAFEPGAPNGHFPGHCSFPDLGDRHPWAAGFQLHNVTGFESFVRHDL
jgi:hypothetical protein